MGYRHRRRNLKKAFARAQRLCNVTAEEARIPIGFEFVEGDHHDAAFITRISVFVYDTQTLGIEAKFCTFLDKMFRFPINFPKILHEKRQNIIVKA